ncbi:transcription antitermination factor NusB [Melghirimyces algeriensis]|uniref:Transcription antitermination protein NusB n=1 Tax=Melghirimyces algeriensis TaxID=910412 RepID=A0A521AZD9_9BACL|nr:transcription antitermination factor NusB [Melghirimyces algeriensis]SMO40159.1 NusB antitermination factor [Melghirimyces algeriensis]
MSRRLVREKALQVLYQCEINPLGKEASVERTIRSLEKDVQEESLSFFIRITDGVFKERDLIDSKIQQYLKEKWTIARLSYVDRSILRMAVYELLYEKEIPKGVTLNEAVELAKTYSAEESARFINGVLGNIARNLGEVEGNKSPVE